MAPRELSLMYTKTYKTTHLGGASTSTALWHTKSLIQLEAILQVELLFTLNLELDINALLFSFYKLIDQLLKYLGAYGSLLVIIIEIFG